MAQNDLESRHLETLDRDLGRFSKLENAASYVSRPLVGPGIVRAQVNNGGDIALFLAPGERLRCALAVSGGMDHTTVWSDMPVRGIATSGWRGRSFSLGIADAVTVLAHSAAIADAAATMIANAVDLPGHPVIIRRPDRDRQADTDTCTWS